jgi:hypothetical protein
MTHKLSKSVLRLALRIYMLVPSMVVNVGAGIPSALDPFLRQTLTAIWFVLVISTNIAVPATD